MSIKKNERDKYHVFNPYDESVVSSVIDYDDEAITDIIGQAYKQNVELSECEKNKLFDGMIDRLSNDKRRIAVMMSKETGLCIKNTLHEVDRAINCVRLGKKELQKKNHRYQSSDFYFNDTVCNDFSVHYEPCDLVVAITPYNHPLNMVMHKVIPAIISGSPIIIKPSEVAPSAAIYLRDMLVDLGLNKDFLNVVTFKDPAKMVRALVSSDKVDVVCFTGSVKVGKLIGKYIADSSRLKRYIPELGGNSPVVVMGDADIEKAVAITLGAFENSGQRCTAVRRIFLHEKIYQDFIDQYLRKTKKIKYGNPMSEDTDMGTVISAQHAESIQSRIDQAVQLGANVLCGNIRQGALLSPTVLDDVTCEMPLVQEENFGPVVTINKIYNINEAIELTKKDRFGLAAAIVTQSKDTAHQYFKNIDVGQFSWNGRPGFRIESAPFGGFKDSGNGEKEGIVMLTAAFSKIKTFYEH